MYDYDSQTGPNIQSYFTGFRLIVDPISEQHCIYANQLARMEAIWQFFLWKIQRKGM